MPSLDMHVYANSYIDLCRASLYQTYHLGHARQCHFTRRCLSCNRPRLTRPGSGQSLPCTAPHLLSLFGSIFPSYAAAQVRFWFHDSPYWTNLVRDVLKGVLSHPTSREERVSHNFEPWISGSCIRSNWV